MTRKEDPFLTEFMSYYIVKPTLRKQESDHLPKRFENHGRTYVMCDSCKMWVKLPAPGNVTLLRHELSKNNFLCVHCYARLEYQLEHGPAEITLRRFNKQMRVTRSQRPPLV
jgi:hypothetical protein